ncbi:heterokaryon incompatibility protein-domain-containing protein, partial [Boeremia exigua]|uniref:heterokaryon incompatibility protein-domain-containing protein n=1 Tax=Boeremia exigua TaxID=749465 RepID=UPI001E8CE64A
MNQFRHKPINLEGYSIRLLRLCKADFGNVQCELIHAYLDDKNIMEYEALSYTWGGSYKAHDVEVDGGMMAVTQNLSLALRSLRKSNEDRILWVDAICIDQENDEEKGHQVSQMGSIFAKAAQVLIWLGPATPETNLVFREISKLTPDQKEGLNDLLSRPWFERVWIIQEVANAKRARVVCGAESVLARTFALFSFLSEISPSQHCQAIMDVMPGPTREYSWWTENHDLNTLLLKFRGSQASEPRDKICALLGISSDRATKGFPVPNYTKSEVEVVQDTVAFLLQLPTGMEGSSYS